MGQGCPATRPHTWSCAMPRGTTASSRQRRQSSGWCCTRTSHRPRRGAAGSVSNGGCRNANRRHRLDSLQGNDVMSTRTLLIAVSLCGALACDGKVEPLSTPQNTNQPLVLRVFVPTTLIQPLERVSVSINLGSAVDAIWTSSDESVATISRGILTGVSPGEATITAVVGGLTGSAVVHVGWRPGTRLFVGSPHFFLDVGTHVTLYPSLIGSAGRQLDGRDVEWTTSSPSIARVDSSGSLVALAAGTTTLVGRFRGIVDSAVVEVGSLIPRFGYFYSGDAVITDADYYGATFWTPALGKSFSTAGSVSATWEPP